MLFHGIAYGVEEIMRIPNLHAFGLSRQRVMAAGGAGQWMPRII